jgi:hypothetical protein
MRLLSFLTTFLVAVLLASCGGGGGSPGISSGPVSTFSVAAPATLTLQVGLTQQYIVQGGVKPYTVFSTNPGVAVGWLVGENVVSVGTVAAGTSVVTVLDAKGSKFDMAVTAGSSTAFFTTSPLALSLSPGPGSSQTYTLGGGTAPYTASSSVPSLVSVKIDGNRMTITGDHVDSVIAALTLRDAAGATLTVAVSVVTTKLTVTTGTYKVFLGDTVRFFISGGTPPYRILDPLNNTVTARIINGNEGEVTGIRLVDPIELIVVDADGQSAPAPKITFQPGGDSFLRVSPDTFTLPESTNSPNIVLNVFGVTPGSPISVFTTNNSRLTPGTPVKRIADGSSYTITLTGGNTCWTPATPAVPAVPQVPGVPGVDNNSDGDFTDPGETPPIAFVPAVPAKAAVPASPLGADVPITITVLDATGRRGTSVVTVQDNGLGGAGCN